MKVTGSFSSQLSWVCQEVLLCCNHVSPPPSVGTSRATLAYQVPHLPIQQLKKTVDDLQAKLALAKGEYTAALKSLERISDEIHERRRSNAMGPRGCGVGAEGSIASVENLPVSKPEPDAISGKSDQQGSVCVICFLCPSQMNVSAGQPTGCFGGFSCIVGRCAHLIATEY